MGAKVTQAVLSGVAAASSGEKLMGPKITRAVLSGVAAASLEAKLIGSTLTPADLSGGSRGRFMIVGWIKNNAINWRLTLSNDLCNVLFDVKKIGECLRRKTRLNCRPC